MKSTNVCLYQLSAFILYFTGNDGKECRPFMGLPTPLNFPPINDRPPFQDIVVRMLRSAQAGMIWEYPHPTTDLQINVIRLISADLTVFLRKRLDSKSEVATFQIQHLTVTAAGIKLNWAAVL